MPRVDRGRPEQILFLTSAMEEMEKYRRDHQRYAEQWHELDLPFVCGPYHLDEPDIRAKPTDGARWRPRNCKSTYVIKSSTPTTVLIQSVDEQGKVEYEIEQGMKSPRKVGDVP